MNKVYPDSSEHNVKFMQTNQTSRIIYRLYSMMLCLHVLLRSGVPMARTLCLSMSLQCMTANNLHNMHILTLLCALLRPNIRSYLGLVCSTKRYET